MKICLANNTGHYHAGCRAVIGTINNQIKENGHMLLASVGTGQMMDKNSVKDCDLLLINGEGTMHHEGVNKIVLDKTIDLAIKYRKPIHLINTVWQAINLHPRYAKINKIITREVLSRSELRSQNLDADLCLDLSYFCKINYNQPVINFHKQIVVGDFFFQGAGQKPPLATADFQHIDTNHVYFSGKPKLTLQDHVWSTVVMSLGSASLYITGRHHGVYAACKAKVPFVVHCSNTHKVEGLFAWAGVKIPIANNMQQIIENVEWAKEHNEEYLKLFNFMENQPFVPFC